MRCRLCNGNEPLIEAHIIPESFYQPLQVGKDLPRIYSAKKGEYPKRAPTGIYDKKILCGHCDNQIGVWDQYAKEVLFTPFDEERYIRVNGENALYELANVDYAKLKLFFISLLWRASITTHDFFSSVNVGPWEAKLREMITNSDPGTEDDFSVILSKFQNGLSNMLVNPMRKRFKNRITYYRLRMADYVAIIKVDKLPFPPELRRFVLKPDAPVLVRIRKHEKSKEIEAAVQIDELLN